MHVFFPDKIEFYIHFMSCKSEQCCCYGNSNFHLFINGGINEGSAYLLQFDMLAKSH